MPVARATCVATPLASPVSRTGRAARPPSHGRRRRRHRCAADPSIGSHLRWCRRRPPRPRRHRALAARQQERPRTRRARRAHAGPPRPPRRRLQSSRGIRSWRPGRDPGSAPPRESQPPVDAPSAPRRQPRAASTSSPASMTSGRPVVRVPVLSKTTTEAAPSRSSGVPPLSTIPRRAARASPETNAIGVARISGHGVATTSTASAASGVPETTQPSPATTSVMGRKTTAARSASRAVRGLVRLGPLDKAHDARVRRRRRRTQRRCVDRLARDARPAANLVSGITQHGERLSGQGSLVEHRPGARERAVDRERSRRPVRTGHRRRPRRPRARRRDGRTRSGVRLPERAPPAPPTRDGRGGRPVRRGARRPTASARRRDLPAYWPSTSAPAIASSAMTSAPSCPCAMRLAIA